MDMQNVSNLLIPEGIVRTIHDKDNRLLWGRLSYNTKYAGNTIQNGTPTPDAPIPVQTVTGEQTVTVTGKNLFDKNNVNQYMGYFDGYADNPSLVYGTTNRNRVIYIKCNPSTAYSISLTTRDGINSPQVGATDSLPATGLEVTKLGNFESGSLKLENLTTPATARYIVIRFQTTPSTVQFDDVSQGLLAGLQIEQSSTASTYEPYQSQSYEINLGKNLIYNHATDKSQDGVVMTMNADGTVTANGNGTGTAFFLLQTQQESEGFAPGTYTIKCHSTLAYGKIIIEGYAPSDLSTKIIDVRPAIGVTEATFTLTAPDTRLRLSVVVLDSSRAPHYFNNEIIGPFQLEVGSTATTYAPFFTPIELCKIGDYQDYIYKSGDDWYVHKEVGRYTLPDGKYFLGISGSSAGPDTQSTAGTFSLLRSDIGGPEYDNIMKSARLCSMASYSNVDVSGNTGATNLPNCSFTQRSGTNDRIYYRNTALTGKTGREVGALFVNSIWYGFLTAPTDTKITDATLIIQLNNVHGWLTRYGYNATVTGNLPLIVDRINL